MSPKTTELKETPSAPATGIPTASVLKPGVPTILTEEKVIKKTKQDPDGFKSMFAKVGKINVRPFIDANKENMGLENYDMAIFPGAHHEEQLAAIERNGVVRYVTGLDEFAPEVQNIVDEQKKEAVIYNIRSIVCYLEKLLATNVLKIDDPEFWNKVKLLRPDNHDFWAKISFRCGNEPKILEPAKDPYDLIKFVAIEAGGFDIIAKSFDDGMAKPVAPKFFLDKEIHTVSTRTNYKKLRNKAIGLLDKLSTSNGTKLMYIAKVIDTNSTSYKVHTPLDVLYDVLDDYIAGKGVEANQTKAAEHFITTAKLDMETLKLKALVKDASFYKVISLKPDGMLYHTSSATMLGRNVKDVVEYLKSPLNEDMLIKLLAEIENFWNS
jgi:hypothetical protein